MTNCKCGCDVKEWCKHIIWVDCGGGYWLYKETLKNQFGVFHDIRPNEHWDFCPVSDCGKARPKRHECKKKSLAEKLHNARHVACHLTEDEANKNWRQHTTASQNEVWGKVAKAAIEHFCEIVDYCDGFFTSRDCLERLKKKFRQES